jgi:hypothetical protein
VEAAGVSDRVLAVCARDAPDVTCETVGPGDRPSANAGPSPAAGVVKAMVAPVAEVAPVAGVAPVAPLPGVAPVAVAAPVAGGAPVARIELVAVIGLVAVVGSGVPFADDAATPWPRRCATMSAKASPALACGWASSAEAKIASPPPEESAGATLDSEAADGSKVWARASTCIVRIGPGRKITVGPW